MAARTTGMATVFYRGPPSLAWIATMLAVLLAAVLMLCWWGQREVAPVPAADTP